MTSKRARQLSAGARDHPVRLKSLEVKTGNAFGEQARSFSLGAVFEVRLTWRRFGFNETFRLLNN